MSRWDPAYIRTDDPDDLELGALCFSKTHTRSPGDMPRGGTIVGIELDVDDAILSVSVLEQPAPGVISTWDIVRSDIEMETVEWYGRNAAVAATIINDWLAKAGKKRDAAVRFRWQRVAFELAEAALSGQWLPKTEARYRRALAAS